jgi:sterol desaturase/sphingolipid hydroxylase (fatty acid hydroxylase superfamily)
MDGKPMFSEKERTRFSVSNLPIQAMIILTPLLLSLVKHIYFVYAVASALVQYTLVLITQWRDIKRKGDVEFAMSLVFADLFCVLTIISYFTAPPTTNAIVNAVINSFMFPINIIAFGMAVEVFIMGTTAFLLVYWSGLLISRTIEYLRETAKP